MRDAVDAEFRRAIRDVAVTTAMPLRGEYPPGLRSLSDRMTYAARRQWRMWKQSARCRIGGPTRRTLRT
jgi:hypothetical protein